MLIDNLLDRSLKGSRIADLFQTKLIDDNSGVLVLCLYSVNHFFGSPVGNSSIFY